MYIEPSTDIRILKNVPLDTTYEHTIFFESANAQSSYFIGLTKYNMTNYSYQRVKRGWARVGINSDNLYDCNYMMFKNSAFGNKWFYAYIKSVEYVNNQCSEIEFEIDVMQTWFFDYEPDYCFIEREHSLTDKIGDNIVPESLDCGEYVYNNYNYLTKILEPLAVIVMVCDETEQPDGTVYDGVYGGCTLYAYNLTDTESIKGKINSYVQKPEAIVGIYMCPAIALEESIPDGGIQCKFQKNCASIPIEIDVLTNEQTIDHYKPKNKKLYTYPYNFLNISCGQNSSIFRYEYFENLHPQFDINVPLTMPVQVALRPKHYKGSGSLTLNSETLIMSDYPMCSWSTDSFRAWLAQNAIPFTNGVSALGIGTVAALSGIAVPTAGLVGGALAIGNMLGKGYMASTRGDISKGSLSSGSINVASGKQNYWCGRASVNKQTAKIIDDYFNMFGYATNEVKKPNRNSRPHWNYVKTIGCTITGSVPCDDMQKICNIYDNGITFWKNGSEVGNYSLDNTV